MTNDREREISSTESRIALAGHPLHVMLVTFPIALATGALGADFFWWLTGDPFFARMGRWVTGWGFAMGVGAATVGLIELLAVRGIRSHPAAWTHGAAGFMLVAIIGANFGLRVIGGTDAILPWGALLSLLGMVFVSLAGWFGGKLVFEHGLGVMQAREALDSDQQDPSS